MEPPFATDVFCRVVDNFGDAGVAWRLASQLANEHGIAVTLYVDDLASLARIVPALDASQPRQAHAGVAIRGMADAEDASPARLVVEAFGCGLPDRYLDRMERAPSRCVWINLEYLSAERWIDDTHGLASPPPKRALSRWFYFPGFTAKSGGLIRERHLFAARDAFLRDVSAQSTLWRDLGVTALPRNALTVSLFSYSDAPVRALLQAFAADGEPVVCVVPAGVATGAVEALIGCSVHGASGLRAGSLTAVVAPFVDQQAFDARLWCCALNFVRGEDSFVRAQWAARPLVWQAYPQSGRAHLAKVEAFVARYGDGLPAPAAALLRSFMAAWNAGDDAAISTNWPAFRAALPQFARHARGWCDRLAAVPELATTLVEFARNRL